MLESSPPKWADRFLEWYCNPALLEEIQGDAYELYYRALKTDSRRWAQIRFVWNVIRFFRWKNIKRSKKSTANRSVIMYQNYFTVFKRGFMRHKGYSFMNVLGLAIGIACFLLISIYIRDELSYDRFHTKAGRIVRVHEIFESDGVGERSASLPFPVADALVNDYNGQIEKAVRFFNFQAPSVAVATVTPHNVKEYNEPRLFFTDSLFFDVFDFDLLKGDKKTALAHVNSIVLTESMARKYFKDEDAIGKYLRIQGNTNLLVTGIMEDTPANAHFQLDFLVSFETLKGFFNGALPDSWYWNPCWTYLLLKDQRSAQTLQAGMPSFVQKYFPDFVRNDITLQLFPLTDIHLRSHMDYEIQPNGSMTTLYIFGSIALFVLLIACINFINLSTAQAAKRAKEVGMRKTLGSYKVQLVTQFLFESVLLTVLSVIIAMLIVVLVLPFFNSFAEKNIAIGVLIDRFYIGLLLLLPLGVGIVSGAYPAFVLSSFKPITALKSGINREQGALFRKALVVVQFSLSITLLIGTGVAMDQLNMLQTSDNGFAEENVIMIPVLRSPIGKNYESLRTEFLRNANTVSVTAVEEIIGAKHQVGNYLVEGMPESKPFPRLNVRHDFLKTFNIQLASGRDYSEDIRTDDTLALIVNEAFVRQMGWRSNEEAVGKTFGSRSNRRIIGVVKDFNFVSKHQPIRPLVIDLNTNPNGFDLLIKYVAVRIKNDDVTGTLAWLERTWKTQLPEWPFEYFFLDSNLANLYHNENKLSRITLVFSGLSIFVACLGLFGLSTYTVEQRRKEMSIRKVLGSSDTEIFMLFSKRFFVLILIANVLAFPLAYIIMQQWLAGFAYKVSIDLWLFVAAALIASGVAFITIGYKALHAAATNPADVLKNE